MASATKIIQKLRNWAAGRNLQAKLQLRYTEIASRSPAPPNLPVGPSHKFANNYYCMRDGRRETRPPTVTWSPQKALAAGTQAASTSLELNYIRVHKSAELTFIVPAAKTLKLPPLLRSQFGLDRQSS
uniref:NADH dehydrogenase [ubiquinone] 1 alpha subcomplex subunit 7 isoform X1 n=1 Tax=Pristiophorus japonicus TaxID=55135 RepID=UPI00398F811F